MRKIPLFLFCVIFLIGILFAGCGRQDNLNMVQGHVPGEMNPERQAVFESMHDNAQAACSGLQAGDACVAESFRGSVPGTCIMMKDVLSCRPDMPDRQKPRR